MRLCVTANQRLSSNTRFFICHNIVPFLTNWFFLYNQSARPYSFEIIIDGITVLDKMLTVLDKLMKVSSYTHFSSTTNTTYLYANVYT